MQKYVYIVIHNVVSRVTSFARNIIGLHNWMNKYYLAIKFNIIGMRLDNLVTGLTIE